MKWLNAIGLILQFVAFWFAAPELLGEATLKRLEKGLQRFVALMPLIIILLVVFVYGFVFIGIAVYNTVVISQTGSTTINPTTYYIALGISTAIYMAIMFNFKRVRSFLDKRLAVPLVQNLINSNEVRRTALLIGAILFTLGFLAQLTVILVG